MLTWPATLDDRIDLLRSDILHGLDLALQHGAQSVTCGTVLLVCLRQRYIQLFCTYNRQMCAQG
jgi:hypothetical protein